MNFNTDDLRSDPLYLQYVYILYVCTIKKYIDTSNIQTYIHTVYIFGHLKRLQIDSYEMHEEIWVRLQ